MESFLREISSNGAVRSSRRFGEIETFGRDWHYDKAVNRWMRMQAHAGNVTQVESDHVVAAAVPSRDWSFSWHGKARHDSGPIGDDLGTRPARTGLEKFRDEVSELV